jgi:hypothetical protein
MTGNSEEGGAGDVTAWCLDELEAMLAEQVRLLKSQTPTTDEQRPPYIRRLKDLIVAARMLAVARAAMARALQAVRRAANAEDDQAVSRAVRAGLKQEGDGFRVNEHNLEQRQAAINARFAAMAPGPHCRGAERHGAGRDERAGGVLAGAGA